MQRVVGSVPYVNARPLVSQFKSLGPDSPVRVISRIPSELPSLLDSGEVEAALVSSFDCLSSPNRRIAAGGVSTFGAAQSVRLFSKVPFQAIETLALDRSSLTSIHLAQIVLLERFRARPTVVSKSPDLAEMLAECDAAVLIGDRGMLADGTGLHVLDLGTEWSRLADLPFVWAAWIGAERLDPDLASHLESAKNWGKERINQVVKETQEEVHWPGDSCSVYLTEIINYDLTPRHLEGLRLFQSLLLKHGFLERAHFPEVVSPGALARQG